MGTIDDIRHANLLLLLKRFKTLQSFADAVGRSGSQISNLKNRHEHTITGEARTIGSDLARDIERRLKLDEGWMDIDHEHEPWPFDLVDRERYDRLGDADREFLQRMINAALTEVEARKPQHPATTHEPRKRYGR